MNLIEYIGGMEFMPLEQRIDLLRCAALDACANGDLVLALDASRAAETLAGSRERETLEGA